MQTLISNNVVNIKVSLYGEQIDNCISLRFDICNNGDILPVNSVSIISYESDNLPFDRFIEIIEQGEYTTTLTIDCTKSKLKLNLNKIQFVFKTPLGDIVSNCVITNQFA